MKTDARHLATILAAALLLAAACPAAGETNVRDVSHLQGSRENKLLAVGMVVGLKGTGDGAKSVEALRALLTAYQRFGWDVQSLADLNADNVALVSVTVTVPEGGAREGDKINVHLAALNGAKSLKGGRLFQCPLLGPTANTQMVYGNAEGPVALEDETIPTAALVKGGALMEEDIIPSYVVNGRITIVLDPDHASWVMASAIAKVINDAEDVNVATAVSPAGVTVTVPSAELGDPADFIGRVMGLPVLMPDRQARVVINARTGSIVVTDDVEIDPVIISQSGLTISTIVPPIVPTLDHPLLKNDSFLLLDPQKKAQPSVKDLLEAFNQLQVPMADRINVIRRSTHRPAGTPR